MTRVLIRSNIVLSMALLVGKVYAAGLSLSVLCPPNQGVGYVIRGVSADASFFAGSTTSLGDGGYSINTPAVWTGTGYSLLPLPAGATGGIANGANNAGIVTGEVDLADGSFLPAYWAQDGFHALGIGDALAGAPSGINGGGIVSGTLLHMDGSNEAVVWQNGNTIQLGTFGLADSFAGRVNSGGAVPVGSYDANGTQHAGIWTAGAYSPITIPSATSVFIKGISDAGTALLLVTLDDGSKVNELWHTDGGLTPLALLPGMNSEATVGINGAGEVFGVSDDGSGSGPPTIWDPSGNPTDVRTLLPAGSTYGAFSWPIVSDSGVIVVSANGPDGVVEVVLTPGAAGGLPVPEPGTLGILVMGFIGPLKRNCRIKTAYQSH